MWEFIFRWGTLWWLMAALYIPSCIGLIVIVLLQKGKGTGFAGAFGIGPGSDTVFGPRASKSLPVRLTHVMAAVFMVLALAMSMISGRVGKGIAPDKVDISGDVLGNTEKPDALDYGILDDLGSAVQGVELPASETPSEPPAEAPAAETPAEAPAETAPAETPAETPAAETAVEEPAGEKPAAEAPTSDAGQEQGHTESGDSAEGSSDS